MILAERADALCARCTRAAVRWAETAADGEAAPPFAAYCSRACASADAPRRRLEAPALARARALAADADADVDLVRAVVKLLCARADVLVMCARKNGCACGRGLDSGFVSTIYAHRASSGRSTRVNERGGVWSYVEKPGWDFQASSRVPLAGRATAPIASYTTGAVVPWAAPRVPKPSNATTPRHARGDADGPRRRPRRNRLPRHSGAGVIGLA